MDQECNEGDWRWQLAEARCGLEDLVALGWGPGGQEDRARELLDRYPFRATPYYLSLIDPAQPSDPIARLCMPHLDELDDAALVRPDPFGEQQHMPVPGVIRRYRDRAVFLVSNRCPVNCRHCTRKNTLSDPPLVPGGPHWEAALDWLRGASEVREILVSGGDPLVLDTEVLDEILGALGSVRHVEVLRVGSRVPVVLPMRIDDALCRVLARHRPLWLNTHFNHPRELTTQALASCDRLVRSGIPVSNQTVLLRGVNDELATLQRLFSTMQRHMIRPYYVFECDPVAGTSHFRVDRAWAIAAERTLRARLGGLAMPRFVADIAGSDAKVPMGELMA